MQRYTSSNVSSECITIEEDLERLHFEWKDLWKQSSGANLFNSPEWLLSWWRVFGNGRLRTFTVRSQGKLIALLPGYLLDGRLQLLGIGTSDCLDLLIHPGFEKQATSAITEAISGDTSEWNEIEFQELPSDSPLLENSSLPDWQSEFSVQSVRPVLSLPDHTAQLQLCIPPHQHQNFRYYRRKAERAGALQFKNATLTTFEETFDALLALHTRQWKARGQPGVLADSSMVRFLKESSLELLRAGSLRLYAMSYEKAVVAVLLGFSVKRRFYYYISGVEPDLAKLSAGTIIIGHAIEEAVREGSTEFDFLRGQEPYKYSWGAQDRQNWNRHLRRKMIASSL